METCNNCEKTAVFRVLVIADKAGKPLDPVQQAFACTEHGIPLADNPRFVLTRLSAENKKKDKRVSAAMPGTRRQLSEAEKRYGAPVVTFAAASERGWQELHDADRYYEQE